jgi:dihydrofolate synthase/folylpolyglutamate synthase
MNFKDAESYLLSLGNEISTLKLGLGNIQTLLRALDDPQNNYRKVQVAGTNGKGSVCAFLEAMCVSAGIKTGLYTSPHLVSITERIRIDGRDISQDDFALRATHIRYVCESLLKEGGLESRPTYFEQVTATALDHFAKAGVEIAILETGLGGRFDATTAANAEFAAITQIAFDHQK